MTRADTDTVLAVLILATAGCVLVWLALRAWRRTQYTAAQAPWKALNYVVARIVWRARWNKRLPVAPDQGAIIVCNHSCPLDPSFIALTVPRCVHWMVAKEYCDNPVLSLMLSAVEAIPVSRGGIDTAATKVAIRHAQQGGLVGILPEGRINITDELLLPGRPGAALIALKARVPVIPCYVHGAPYDGTSWGCLLMPAKVTLTVGDPIDISAYYGREDREVLEMLTLRFLREIAALAGRKDFVPRLAGRFYKPGLADE